MKESGVNISHYLFQSIAYVEAIGQPGLIWSPKDDLFARRNKRFDANTTAIADAAGRLFEELSASVIRFPIADVPYLNPARKECWAYARAPASKTARPAPSLSGSEAPALKQRPHLLVVSSIIHTCTAVHLSAPSGVKG